MEEQTDEKLMAEVAKGDLDLLKVLFERHHVHVFNFLLKMSKDKMLSEDITQDVFYKVMKYRTSYNNGKFVSWIFTIARNSLKSHYTRSAEKHQDLDTVIHFEHDEIEEKNEEHTHLHKALSKLETADRELLILNRFQEIKYAELAEIMGSTPGAIKTRVSRALKKLKTIYFENI
ncbi:RNA polymerase sigma-70 factor (ECF subfamily) [Saonia flava]|uniref:RNA polymerase sigma-70 factor (ECF subfamily) n=1 Tax=Saonia flava TaxID=523696 RepID=A0A846QYK4_9FLAO|nr:RNA polymerase sigma factor [Saonia flava]NJB71722.1 RNA polymerase sigma-70 factor (ECF subfamily) [Saonia flava]